MLHQKLHLGVLQRPSSNIRNNTGVHFRSLTWVYCICHQVVCISCHVNQEPHMVYCICQQVTEYAIMYIKSFTWVYCIWHQLKGFYSSYLVLKFGNVLPIRNLNISRNVIFPKVKVIGQNKWHNRIPWPQKHSSRHQNRHPKSFSSKVMVKDIFLHNGGQYNAFAYITRSNHPRYFFIYWKAPTQAILC